VGTPRPGLIGTTPNLEMPLLGTTLPLFTNNNSMEGALVINFFCFTLNYGNVILNRSTIIYDYSMYDVGHDVRRRRRTRRLE